MKKGGATAQSHKKDTHGPSTGASTNPKSSDAPISKAEMTAVVEKTVADVLARQMADFQVQVTQSTKQQVQSISDSLQQLGDKSQEATAKNLKQFEEAENSLKDLHQGYVKLEKLVKKELDGIVDEKVRLRLNKIHPESEVEKEKGKWSEQLATNDSAHQQEIQKLHEQHHQDMLSVINDCCRKLKTSFTRQHKPYEVNEIHATIDDVEQKMVQEILSEIEKTHTHEDLSSFEEALVTSGLSGEVHEGREFNRLPSDEIAASLEAFERDNVDSFAQDLESAAAATAAAAAAAEDELPPVVEESISASRSMITGDRGNIYYMEELKRTVDDMIGLEAKTGVNPSEGEAAPELPPKTKSYEEVEKSLESLIISSDAAKDFDSWISKDLEEKDKTTVVDSKPSEHGKRSETAPETSQDQDRLKSLEALAEGDMSWADILPSSERDKDQSKSSEAVIDPVTTTPATSTRDQDLLKSLEGMLESSTTAPPALVPRDRDAVKSLEGKLEPGKSAPALVPKDRDTLKSHEGKLEPDPRAPAVVPRDRDTVKSLEGKLEPGRSAPAVPKDPDTLKSLEGKLEPGRSAPAVVPRDRDTVKSLEGKLEPDPSAESALGLDQMKSLEAMLEAQMADSVDSAGRDISKEHIEPKNSARQQLKANLSEQVTASAFQPTETKNVTGRTGFGENPYYVEEVINAATSAPKEKP